MVCGLPLSRIWKSFGVRFPTARPCLSRTTTRHERDVHFGLESRTLRITRAAHRAVLLCEYEPTEELERNVDEAHAVDYLSNESPLIHRCFQPGRQRQLQPVDFSQSLFQCVASRKLTRAPDRRTVDRSIWFPVFFRRPARAASASNTAHYIAPTPSVPG